MIITAIAATAAMPATAQNTPVSRPVSLFSDVKAHSVGDVLTVIISENTSASNNARTSTAKESKTDASGNATTGALSGLFPGMSGSVDVKNDFKGQGSSTRSANFQSQLSVRVVDVLPNGNLVIEGTKTMEINNETEVVVLSGLVQPVDITADNTVYSYQLANAKFSYKGKGALSQGHRPGILVRFFNWLF